MRLASQFPQSRVSEWLMYRSKSTFCIGFPQVVSACSPTKRTPADLGLATVRFGKREHGHIRCTTPNSTAAPEKVLARLWSRSFDALKTLLIIDYGCLTIYPPCRHFVVISLGLLLNMSLLHQDASWVIWISNRLKFPWSPNRIWT